MKILTADHSHLEKTTSLRKKYEYEGNEIFDIYTPKDLAKLADS